MSLGVFPIKYLGIPFMDHNLKSSNFGSLQDKIYSWLVGWKAKILFYSGRIQFIRYFINGLLSYWLRGTNILKGILKKINSLVVKLFFHGMDQNKVHMIAWTKSLFLLLREVLASHLSMILILSSKSNW